MVQKNSNGSIRKSFPNMIFLKSSCIKKIELSRIKTEEIVSTPMDSGCFLLYWKVRPIK